MNLNGYTVARGNRCLATFSCDRCLSGESDCECVLLACEKARRVGQAVYRGDVMIKQNIKASPLVEL